MTYLNKLDNSLETWNLLKHPFYQAWNMGQLKTETLHLYAEEYYFHVAAFPRYISQIHSLCNDIKSRQILLENLIDEEKGDNNHPALWLRFAQGIGAKNCGNKDLPQLESTNNLVEGFFNLVRESYPSGLGALYAYERQTPEISKSKIAGLKQHYNIFDNQTLEFFHVHQQADEWHTQELQNLINNLNEKDQIAVYQAALSGAKLLWGFLDGINLYAN